MSTRTEKQTEAVKGFNAAIRGGPQRLSGVVETKGIAPEPSDTPRRRSTP